MAMMENKINVSLLITIIGMSAFLLIVIGVGVQAWFGKESTDETARLWEDAPNIWLNDLRAAQRGHLTEGRWLDANHGAAVIPIEQAMDLVVKNGGKMPATQPTTTQSSTTQPTTTKAQ